MIKQTLKFLSICLSLLSGAGFCLGLLLYLVLTWFSLWALPIYFLLGGLIIILLYYSYVLFLGAILAPAPPPEEPQDVY